MSCSVCWTIWKARETICLCQIVSVKRLLRKGRVNVRGAVSTGASCPEDGNRVRLWSNSGDP